LQCPHTIVPSHGSFTDQFQGKTLIMSYSQSVLCSYLCSYSSRYVAILCIS